VRRLSIIVRTIETIVRSPLVKSYNIGITVDSRRRRSQYKNFDPSWPHFLIIETGLDASRALNAEREIQEMLKANKRSILFQKYRGDTREKKHSPSLGGIKQENSRSYDLYICWGNQEDYKH